jgi:hypothetical protein
LRSVLHRSGGYRYLPAISAYSAGVAAEGGYEIDAIRFHQVRPLAAGFDRIDQVLAARGLAPWSLAAVELRSPAVFDLDSFHRFNDEYLALLRDRELIVDGANSVARTNVVPLHDPPATPGVLTAFLVRPHGEGERDGTDFVVAGAGEMANDLQPGSIIAQGDTSDAGLARKVDGVIEEMAVQMAALGVTGPNVVNVYTAHQPRALHERLVTRFPSVGGSGYVRWLTRPPVRDVEFEMDCRRVSRWQYI